nr:bifunctional 2',3'-cyclic-nucleotide 2'-phosphodiesterase/3'-nucleotidase [uncultured Lichenicoccus sp.]
MNAISRRAVVASVGGLAASRALPAQAGTAVAALKLRLLETSDLHMFVYDYDYYASRQDNTVGLAKVSTLITAARKEARNSLLFDNGDIIQGNPLGDYMALPGHLRLEAGHPMFRAMNLLGYDAATFGNHEFNYGLDFLHAALRTARFPFVCANIETLDGKPFAPPTMVLTRRFTDEAGQMQTVRIGVIGFVTPQIMVWDKTKLEGHIRTVDIVDAARRYVPDLRRQADIVVALSHSGIAGGERQGGEENASLHLAAVPGIDVIFTGHQHRVFPGPDYADVDGADAVRGTLGGKPAVMPGFWGSRLGIIDLTLEKNAAGAWSVAEFKVEPRPIYRREGRQAISLAADDARLLAAVAVEHQATLRWMEQPVGSTTRPINTFFSLIGNDPSLSLVNAAQLWYARPLLVATRYGHLPVLSAAAPFKAGGMGPDSFVDIQPGPLDMKDIANLYMFANTVCAVRCNGAEVREWLERSAAIFNRIDPAASEPQELVAARVPSYMFDVISGVTYAIDLSQPERYGGDGRLVRPDAHRIVDLRHDDRPVDPAQEFIVVTNNYRADGGGGFSGTGGGRVVLAAPDFNRDVIVRYVMAHRSITPAAEAVWRFAPLQHPVVLAFNGNAETAKHLGEHPGVIRLGDGPDGYTRYGLTLA